MSQNQDTRRMEHHAPTREKMKQARTGGIRLKFKKGSVLGNSQDTGNTGMFGMSADKFWEEREYGKLREGVRI